MERLRKRDHLLGMVSFLVSYTHVGGKCLSLKKLLGREEGQDFYMSNKMLRGNAEQFVGDIFINKLQKR